MIKVAILTISDSVATGKREDLSGPALHDRCHELGWRPVASLIVPDDELAIAQVLREWADTQAASVILTTGGTGVSPRDITPEATRGVLEREIPGLAELMRLKGQEQTKFSVLSRGLAGTRNRSVIVNLPGSPRGAVFSLDLIQTFVSHVIDLMEGRTDHEPNAKLEAGIETQGGWETSQDL